MKKPKCKHCGKEIPRGYKEYYNPTAGLWGVTTCTKCGQVDSIEDVRPGFTNLAARHRWYLHLLRIACTVIVGFCVGNALTNHSLDGRLRITLGVIAFLTPGFYGVLKGSDSERTAATNKEELQESLRKGGKQDESSNNPQ